MRRIGAAGRALWSGLDHPWIARVSTAAWMVGAAIWAVKVLDKQLGGKDPLAIAALALMVLGLLVYGATLIARWRGRRAMERRLPSAGPASLSFAEQLDALLRDGMALREQIEAAPLAEETSPGSFLARLDPHPDLDERVGEFRERVATVLKEQRPARLRTYADAANASLRSERERKADGGGPRKVSPRELVETMQRGPLLAELDSCLDGLAAARNALGD